MIMYPGDLLIQPNWAWHDHGNHSKEPIIWIDALDTGLVHFLSASFREEWSEGMKQLPARKDGTSRRLYGRRDNRRSATRAPAFPTITDGERLSKHYRNLPNRE